MDNVESAWAEAAERAPCKYTVDFFRDGERVDQWRVCGHQAFDAECVLADHCRWHPEWPGELRPNEAREARRG